MDSSCPYCGLAGLYGQAGDIYCSKGGTNIDKLDNALFRLPLSKSIETDPHYTRLTLRFAASGGQLYTVDGTPKLLAAGRCLLMNMGQQYRIRALDNSFVTGVAFKPSFVSAFNYSYTHSQSFLLDNPDGYSAYSFAGGVHAAGERLGNLINRASGSLSDGGATRAILLPEIYVHLLEELCSIDVGFVKLASRLEGVKSTTRRELLKRLKVAIDYMDAYAADIQDIAQVAQAAALSEFHFYRSFKKLTGASPYQYLRERKMERAAIMLRQTSLPVADICLSAGFADASSFSRLFRKLYRCAPGEYRQRAHLNA